MMTVLIKIIKIFHKKVTNHVKFHLTTPTNPLKQMPPLIEIILMIRNYRRTSDKQDESIELRF